MTSDSIASPLDEVARLIIAVEGNFFDGARRFVPIAFDRDQHGSIHPCLIPYFPKRLAFLERHEVFYALCNDRAQRCVGAQLKVNGGAILPEDYLALWRTASSYPLSPHELLAFYAVRIIAVLAGPLAPLKGTPFPWQPSPFGTFDDFVVHCGTRMHRTPDERFRLELDLTEQDAVRDAYHGAVFLGMIWEHAGVISQLELRVEDTRSRDPIPSVAP
jgi:hypothetical protein